MSLFAPTNLQATVVSGTEVALTWDRVPQAITYIINQDGVNAEVSGEPFINVTGLTPETAYSFYVIAEGFDGTESTLSPPSDTVTVTTTAATPDVPGSLAAPGIISADQTGIDEATITWGAVTDATGYEVRIDGGAAIDVGNTLGYTTTASLAAGNYTFEVRAYAGAGPDVFSAWSLGVVVTIAALTAPSPSATVLSSGAIEVTWVAVPPADRYQIRIDNDKIFSSGSLLEYIDSGLAPVTTRSYEVRGLIDGTAQVGPWSTPIEATTNRSIEIEIIGRLRRLSTYLADRHITARSLNAEFNNIYALLNGGTLTVLGPAEADSSPTGEPTPPPPPTPDPDAEIAASPTFLGFATTTVGNSTPARTLTVSNPGAVDTVIGDVTIASPNYLLTTDNCSNKTLAPGGTCTLGIQFAPLNSGLLIGDVSIPSTDPDSPLDIPLSGSGEAAPTDPTDPTPPPPDTPDPTTQVLVKTTTVAAAGTSAVALPTAAAGDVLVLVMAAMSNPDVTTPTGWSLLDRVAVQIGGDAKFIAMAKVADGTEAGSVDVAFNQGNAAVATYAVNRSLPAGETDPADVYVRRNQFNGVWPTLQNFGLNDAFAGQQGITGKPALFISTAALTANLIADADPGSLLDQQFDGMAPVQLTKSFERVSSSTAFKDLTLAHTAGVFEAAANGDGAGLMTFSNAGWAGVWVISFVAIELSP